MSGKHLTQSQLSTWLQVLTAPPDAMRKGMGEQAQEKLTPDSQKSTLDKASETATGLGDKAAASVQPSDTKSTTQKAGDSVRGGADDAQSEVCAIH